jgi:putative DNA primase/helicase
VVNHALAYAANGYPVFPAKATADRASGSKAPHLPNESEPRRKDGGHWLASCDAATVRGWWRRWPDALIGFPTGLRSACVVIDLDPREHAVKDMLAALTRWCGHLRNEDGETGEILEPAIARTQSGGLHLYFAWPDAPTFDEIARNLLRLGGASPGVIGNRTGLFRAFVKAEEAPAELGHIDVRGEGGYVIAPPSVMSDGKAYEWVVPRGEVLPPLPRRLRDAITGEFIPAAVRRERVQAQRRAQSFSGHGISDQQVRVYVERCVRGALRSAADAGEGNRNAAVFWAACRLGEFVRGGVLSWGEAEQLLLDSLPAGVSPSEPKVRGTIKSGLSNTKSPAFWPEMLNRGGRREHPQQR